MAVKNKTITAMAQAKMAQGMGEEEALKAAHKEFFDNVVAVRRANMANKGKKAETTGNLLDYAKNIGKQATYKMLVSAIEQAGLSNMVALTMPGENDVFESMIAKKVEKFHFLERDLKTRAVINKNTWEKPFTLHGVNFASGQGRPFEAPRTLDFAWFDFMGAFSSRYFSEFAKLLSNNDRHKMVLAITIGTRGQNIVPVEEVASRMASEAKDNGGWETAYTMRSDYLSDNSVRMSCLVFSFYREEVPNNRRKEILDEIAKLQSELEEIGGDLNPKPSYGKKGRKKK